MLDFITERIVDGSWISYFFALLMGMSFLIYAVLDGYDLGVGILCFGKERKVQNHMISSIGPFWDANETWLVLSIGLMLVAFPSAYGLLLTHLYIPVFVMLLGIIFRGISFELRIKVSDFYKPFWYTAFSLSSLVVALSQGFMVGSYVLGLQDSSFSLMFQILTALTIAFSYTAMGSCWLMAKGDDSLVDFAKKACASSSFLFFLSVIILFIITPILSSSIAFNWFSLSWSIKSLFILILSLLFILYFFSIKKSGWLPFFLLISIELFCFISLMVGIFPYVLPGTVTVEGASISHESLMFLLIGSLVMLPLLIIYTVYVYRVFHGRIKDIEY